MATLSENAKRAMVHIQHINYAQSFEELDKVTHFAGGYLQAARNFCAITPEEYVELRGIKGQFYAERTLMLSDVNFIPPHVPTGVQILRYIHDHSPAFRKRLMQ